MVGQSGQLINLETPSLTQFYKQTEFVGLDPAGYRQSMRSHDNEEEDALLGGADISEEEKYKDCDRYKWKCPKCQKEIIVDAVFTGVVSSI